MRKFGILLFVLLMVVCLSSCNKTDYQNVIPADATLVAKVNVKNMAEKSDFAQSSVADVLKGGLALVVSGKDLKQAKAYVDDPMAMGWDLSMPAYAFMIGSEYAGFTMKVADEDAVKDFILLLHKQHLATKPVERHELMCGTLLDELYYAYDGNTFLLLAKVEEKGGVRIEKLAQQLMNQTEDASFVSTEAYDKMEEAEKDIVWYSNLAALPDEVANALMDFLPQSVKKRDIELMSSISFEDGAAVVQANVWGKTDKTQQLLEEMNKNLCKMEGRYIGKVTDNMLVWLGMGVKGEWLLQKMKENKDMKEQLFLIERAVDIEQMLKAVDGDVAVEVPEALLKNNEEAFVAYAKLKNTDFLQDVDEWKSSMKDYGMSMDDDGSNHYVLQAEGHTLQWGVEGNDLYTMTGIDPANLTKESSSNSLLKAYGGDIKKSIFFLYINLSKMGLDEMFNGELKLIGKAVRSIEALIVKSSSANEVTLMIETKNKKENFLKQLL